MNLYHYTNKFVYIIFLNLLTKNKTVFSCRPNLYYPIGMPNEMHIVHMQNF